MNPYRRFVNNTVTISILVSFVMSLQLRTATAQQTKPAAGSGFSFAAYGDSRPMMYLPSKDGQPDLTKLFVEMFGLVMPEKVAEEVVKKDVKMIFDPATKELIKVVMPFTSKTEVMTLTVDKGWVTEASVEDVKLLPGVHRTMFRLQGGDWVAREIVKDVQSGRAKFVVNSGDVVWWGNQGRTVNDSPYWKRVNDTMLKQLPPPDDEMRAAGLEGRWFIGRGQSRGVGRSEDRGRAERRALSEEVRRHAGEPHLQVRLQGRPLHLPVERQVRLPVALAVGCRPAEICGADEADAAVAGRGQGQGHPEGLHHLPLSGVLPGRAWAPSPPPTIRTR